MRSQACWDRSVRISEPPFLELSFYVAGVDDKAVFVRLIRVLLDQGATFVGEGRAHLGPGLRDRPFARITDEVPQAIPLGDSQSLDRWLTDPDARLLQVYIAGASNATKHVAEIVTYQGMSDDATATDKHPVAIWTEGQWLCTPSRQQNRRRVRDMGRRVYGRFRTLVSALRPSYAAITVEYALECPTDLRRDPRSLAFGDFFVSRDYLSPAKLQTMREMFSGACTEMWDAGLYVSTMAELNPEGKQLQNGRADLSVRVAKMIGATGPR